MRRIIFICPIIFTFCLNAQEVSKFKQLKEELATPNIYRTASGAPGQGYYQQQADYVIEVVLDDVKQSIRGTEIITYHNNSPDALTYLWLQLDQNLMKKDSDTKLTSTNTLNSKESFSNIERMHSDFDGGFKIAKVVDGSGNNLPYTINKTMMRIDLPQVLKPSSIYTFKIEWQFNINDRIKLGGRSGYEYFSEDDNYLYTIAQFFPRMAVYNDVEGWQHKQFLGRGEFTLPFGNYQVNITLPSDLIVGATGELQNISEVLNSGQRTALEKARNEFTQPIFIVNAADALQNEKSRSKSNKTWKFKAVNVRDFAFAASRKFIWDAMSVKAGSKNVLCMSFYPKEGNPLWEQYSTKVVAHTISTYSKHTIDYPYPVAQSIHTKWIGMEYPMICFNGGRPEKDGTYSKSTKYGMISVIIHEVGHNFFPMIINSDERQWTWMDEGLNTFVQYLSEQEWEKDYPSHRGPPQKIVDYMKGEKTAMSPIMTNSESVKQFGNNAYGKPATALNILRETVMGRDLFDFSFKTYCRRWAFRHPTPEDFFRTMEDASAVDLDWFWRGWFYTNDHCDMSINSVKWMQIDSKDPVVENAKKKNEEDAQRVYIGEERNKNMQTYLQRDSSLADFYTSYDPLKVSTSDLADYEKYSSKLSESERKLIASGKQYYQIEFENKGGLVMPVILQFELADGNKETVRIPAEIWRMDEKKVSKVFFFDTEVKSVNLDPFLETADCDLSNNHWPPRPVPGRFELYKQQEHHHESTEKENPMQKEKRLKSDSDKVNEK